NNLRSWREKSDWVHKLAPEIKRIEAVEAPDFGDSLEVWVPKLSHYRTWRDWYEKARQRGAELWFYTCCHPCGRYPNRFIDYALIKTRILHWLNWRYDLTGYLHWGLNWWNADPFASATSGNLPPGDAWIVYPGPEGPLDSIRWEALRDGIEDYEYLWLLTETARQVKEKLGEAAKDFEPRVLADQICALAVRETLDYVRDPAALRALRRKVAEEIVWLQSEPSALVWTAPPTDRTIAYGPATPVVFVAAERGASVKIGGSNVELDERGFGARHLFFGPGQHDVPVEIARGEASKTKVLRFTVAY
ncbi:MAG: DUF4091 domain-containing protein, partial [Armatimonadetes bacterium]|nr:DUF4091 domain-containing protein [Armatimonadota bacterium]